MQTLSTSIARSQWVMVVMFFLFCTIQVFCQEEQSVQVKTFDTNLQVVKNTSLSINEKEYFLVGEKGVAIITLKNSELPIQSISVRDEKLETASWNFSKGILEVIIRPKNYYVYHFAVRLPNGTELPGSAVTFAGLKTVSVVSNQQGEFDLPVSLQENITSHSQFKVAGYKTVKLDLTGSLKILTVEQVRINNLAKDKKQESIVIPQGVDLSLLDSINSLTVFYSVFKNYDMREMSAEDRRRVDAKFNLLVAQLQDSLSRNAGVLMGNISDSSFVSEDIRNLVKTASKESELLKSNKEEFQRKIDIIAAKLEKGVSNLTESERKNLLTDLDLLEQLLIKNEGKFYKNQEDYHNIINTLREEYFNVENLEKRLTTAEMERESEQREFRSRMLWISVVVSLFVILTAVLFTFSNRLRSQKNALKAANEEINTINENLEAIVIKRTSLLEESNKELDTFLYRASHDLRSPIRSILGLCNVQEHISSDEYVKRVADTTLGMDRMLKKLTCISEISESALNASTFQLAEVINGQKEVYAVAIANNDIEFHVDCPAALSVNMSKILMENLLTNLFENAIYFTSIKNTNQKRVEVTVKEIHNGVELSIFDNGVGIPDDVQPNVFNMFYKGSEMSKGNGLGLYIVKKCIEALQGVVFVESTAGRYAKFTMVLPVTIV